MAVIPAIKVILTVIAMLLLCYPFIPMKGALRKLSVASTLQYHKPHNRKNGFFVLLALIEFAVIAIIFRLLDSLAAMVTSVPFINGLLTNISNSINSQVDYILLTVKVILINILIIYAFVLLKAFLKCCIISPLFGLSPKKNLRGIFGRKNKKKKKKKKSKKKNADEETDPAPSEEEQEAEKLRRRKRVTQAMHTVVSDAETPEEGENEAEPKKKKEYGPLASFFLSLCFEGEEFRYARNWVVRARTIIQSFIYMIETLYVLLFLTMLLSAFFPLPMGLYRFFIDVLRIDLWFAYPVFSVIFLQELCNVFNTDHKEEKTPEEKKDEEAKDEEAKREARLRALLAELKRRFDAEHSLRYYPEAPLDENPEYECTNVMFASALRYIKEKMKELSGRVVNTYMECLDATFKDNDVYFSASFYSEFGEYLTAYTYVRLLSGSRLIFVVSDPTEKETLREFISDRLMHYTGSNAGNGWRVYTSDERLDQADILIASPEDFINTDIIEQYPSFFEETCNAIFIDADRMIALNGYLCTIIATKLRNATGGRVRYIFLSLDLLKGFAAGSLPRFFCVDKVLSFSSAGENEAVSYILWNKESKKHRIYNNRGQKNISLEAIIAEQACEFGVDGVRLITESPLEHADREMLAIHHVEINKLYKNRVDVNYMIYSDERCNLSAALYACTRFRGESKSVVHIISKPYLLREYFMSKAITEDFIKHASFIQPRVTERAERSKLSLLRIFCNASYGEGMSTLEFIRRMKEVISATKERQDEISSVFCRRMLAEREIDDLKFPELAAFLIAGLTDNDKNIPPEREDACYVASLGHRAKDFYIVTGSSNYNAYSLRKEKYIIFNRVREILDRLLASNRQVELHLNDRIIGKLDTFPDRANLEYVAGQSIIFDNSEYEIEKVAEDGRIIYLRHENISIKNCLDTILLRKYEMNTLEPLEHSAVLNNSQSVLEEIRVTRCRANFSATTYGFYSITTDRQTLDFYRGAEGNPCFDHPSLRHYESAGVLHVSLKLRRACNDGMRLLMAAVFNEFIRTLFPAAYRCVAIVPILENPLSIPSGEEKDLPLERIRTLYPFLNEPKAEFIETDEDRMQFLFINDCVEDIGVLDWFYDRSGRYMQEFLANVYSYLHWLKLRPEKDHYIYFGGEKLPECYDLDGCCEALSGLNLILSDRGAFDIETAGDDVEDEHIEYCSFCHRPMERGRYSYFDKNRFICAECFDVVNEQSRLDEIYLTVKEYLLKHYPEVNFGAAKVKFDNVYELTLDEILSEYYSRVDFAERTICVEVDNPINNVRVAILRGIIALWQVDNGVANHYASAQLYYEEIEYLRHLGQNDSAAWVYHNVPADIRDIIDEMYAYTPAVAPGSPEEPGEEDPSEADGKKHTSFTFMYDKDAEMDAETEGDPDEEADEEEYSDRLYDPNKTPRFWKRYLRGKSIDDDDGEEDFLNAEDEEEPEEDEDLPADEPLDGEDEPIASEEDPAPNSPPPGLDEEPVEDEPLPEEPAEDEISDEPALSDKEAKKLQKEEEKKRRQEEKKRLREEKKQAKEEKRRAAFEKWSRGIDEIIDEENEKNAEFEGGKKGGEPKKGETPAEPETPEKKKGLFSLFGKKKKDKAGEEGEGETPATPEEEPKKKEKQTPVPAKKTPKESTEEEPTIDDPVEEEPDEEDPAEEEPSEKKEKPAREKKKPKEKKPRVKLSPGEKILPHEPDEESNPKIRLYNDLVRAAYNYSEDPVSREGISDAEVSRIFRYVMHDYPELFWIHGYQWNSQIIKHDFRCKDDYGNLDRKMINQKLREIRQATSHFTRGISRRTDPFEAVLTIYRRVILSFDYDMKGLRLQQEKGQDTHKDDVIRSLHAALTTKKVVCAGYAVAMQYLLQSVGIVCGYVSSESDAGGTTHAFNMLKIGKYCYYLDATWGDSSFTTTKENKNRIGYDYFCVPYREFLRTAEAQIPNHKPRQEFYPSIKEYNFSNHEYYRHNNAYMRSYNEEELARIFAEAAMHYDKNEMGEFSVSFRCADPRALSQYEEMLFGKYSRRISAVLEMAGELAAKNRRARKLLECETFSWCKNPNTGVMTFYLHSAESKGK